MALLVAFQSNRIRCNGRSSISSSGGFACHRPDPSTAISSELRHHPASQPDAADGSEDQPPTKNNPINVFGIDHVVLLVDDLQGMSEWYQTVLGCTVAKTNDRFQMIHLDAGSALIDLVDRKGPLGNSATPKNTDTKMEHICLGLVDFDVPAIEDHLSSHGVAISTGIGVRYGKGGYGESLYFSDPEGTRIEIRKTNLL